MCYAIPGKIVAIHEKTVTVEYFGETKTALNEFKTLKLGDYIYAQGGYILEVVPETEALGILEAWREVFQDLKETDAVLSRVTAEDHTQDQKLNRILDKAANEAALSDADLLYVLSVQNPEQLNLLSKTANFLRQKYLQNSCCVHGIIELSNICARACQYCGINCGNTSVTRYKMSLEEVLAAAKTAIEDYSFKALVLQSGEGAYTIDELVTIVQTIKERWPCLIFISFGEIGLAGLEKLYAAGARGLLLRFETSNEQLYTKIHPGMSLQYRLEHLKKAYELGYLVLTGSLIGLPDQTDQDIINDIRLAKELHAEMFSFGPFVPAPGTPLAAEATVTTERIIKTLAMARLMDAQQAKILITTALETIDPMAREQGLLAGGNSVMLNVTPLQYRSLYSIYPNRAHITETIPEQIEVTIALLKKLGRAPTDLSV